MPTSPDNSDGPANIYLSWSVPLSSFRLRVDPIAHPGFLMASRTTADVIVSQRSLARCACTVWPCTVCMHTCTVCTRHTHIGRPPNMHCYGSNWWQFFSWCPSWSFNDVTPILFYSCNCVQEGRRVYFAYELVRVPNLYFGIQYSWGTWLHMNGQRFCSVTK